MTGLQDLASGQANIGTPARSRLDSQTSGLGIIYPAYKVDENAPIGHKLLEHKFQSPNVRGKFLHTSDVPVSGHL